jgi:Zn-dependent peptidase ImmA (M78 family)
MTPAEKLLQSLGIDDPKEIDLEAIAWHMGALVKRRPLDGCEALIVGNQRKAIISVNSSSIETRQRFSIAHEIGHWHHHRGRMLLCDGRDFGSPTSPMSPEKQADDFASDLILPNYLFLPIARKLKRLNLKAGRDIAELFRASLTATLIKLVKSDYFPIMLVCHSQSGRKWPCRPPSLQRFWYPKEELDPESPAFDLLFRGGREDGIPRKIGADAWFDFRGAERYQIQEQSFSLPSNEILTLLVLPDSAME